MAAPKPQPPPEAFPSSVLPPCTWLPDSVELTAEGAGAPTHGQEANLQVSMGGANRLAQGQPERKARVFQATTAGRKAPRGAAALLDDSAARRGAGSLGI
jgi:hypothetical protein